MRGGQPLYTIVQFRETPTSSRAANKDKSARNISKRFSRMESNFGAVTDLSIVKQSMDTLGKHPEDLKKMMKDNNHLLLIVGYFIPSANHSSDYKEIPEADFNAEARLAYLIAKLKTTKANDPSTAREISAELVKLAKRYRGLIRNPNLVRLLRREEDFDRKHAALALQEAKDLWPGLFEVKRMDKFDVEHMHSVAVALEGRLRDRLIVDYSILKPFLAMTIVLDYTGEMQHLIEAYDIASQIFWSTTPTKNKKSKQAEETEMEVTVALTMVKRDIKAMNQLIGSSSTSVKQHAARCFGMRTMPLPMSLNDAIKGLANTHEVGAAKVYVQAIYTGIVNKFHDMLAGPLQRHVDGMLKRV
ncbi:hypothetical protein LX32DRAFT_649460 [Colletotrichum zoysiae]|uniref:Uncharacterized protein n=1 Tax=Colletotrichum zoysiae TaxID=1216348 RepID=A0AAD9M8W4_9PEZI|nr:hypothetical protein LX32DRAFT_649460 [Colletotrichum zoysiae]